MLILLIVGLFGALALALFGLAAAFTSGGAASSSRLRGLLGVSQPAKPSVKEKFQTALEPAARLLPASAKEVGQTRAWLVQAGWREDRHARLFFAARAALTLVFLLVVGASGWAERSPALWVGAPLLGFVLPRFYLKRRVRSRGARVRLSLPDALDLMVICVESGLGFDQAMQRVALELKTVHIDLCEELELLSLEMKAGVPRSEALRNLTKRCDVDDLRALAAVLIQADRFGTSVTHSLRIHSEALRVERRQRAEEKAAKVSIKMLPVLALLIFPAIMIVTLGPVVLAMRQILPMINP